MHLAEQAASPQEQPAAFAPREGLQHQRFSECKLWARQRAYFQDTGVEAWRRGEVPHYVTSTAGAAHVYADAIARYWMAARAAGDIDPREPLYVLELGAGCGRFTYLLVKALRRRLAHEAPLRWCLVASDIVHDNLDFIASHPLLQSDVAEGRLDTALWDAEEGSTLALRAQRTVLAQARNPLVVVSNYVFDGLRHDLFGFHRGQLFEGRVALLDQELDYQWRPLADADWLPAEWRPMLARYAQRLADASVLLPSGALRCITHLEQLAPRGYLLLSSDKGAASERQLRRGCGAELVFHGSFSLPVNYHAIAAFQASRGALTANCRHSEEGLVQHVALQAPHTEPYADCFAAISDALEQLTPDDHFLLKKAVEAAAHQLAPEQLLALLRFARHDSRVLAFMIDALLPLAPALVGESRRLWQRALELCWDNYFPLGEEDAFTARFASLACEFGAWGLARQALELELALHGEHPAPLYQLACCEAATGQSHRALACLERALALAPHDAACRALQARLVAARKARCSLPWYRPELAGDGELTLEPVTIEHAAALLAQYQDPQIAELTRLPDLATLEEAVEWIVLQRATPDCMTCAVMHRCKGLVGMVSLRHDEAAGYFWFWMGGEHQGGGLGRRAAAMLFDLAAAAGLRELFTSAYVDNARSRQALAALGFGQLDARAEAPDEDLLFFQRRLPGGDEPVPVAPTERLQRLCEAIDSPLRLKALPCQAQVRAALTSDATASAGSSTF